MYILNNAIKNLGRNRGRNILMGVIVFAIILTTAISIIINTTTSDIIANYKAKFGVEATISPNVNKIKAMKDPQTDFKQIKPQQYLTFTKSNFLQDSYYTVQISGVGENLKGLDQNQGNMSGAISIGGEKITMPNVMLMGYSRQNLDTDFTSGLRKIIAGKFFKDNSDECIVSQKFAQLNSLKPGDKIKIDSTDKNNKLTQEFTISGIYSDDTELQQQSSSSLLNRGDEIITDVATLTKTQLFQQTATVNATYILKDPSLLSQFDAQLKEMGLPDYYSVSTNQAEYEQVVGPVEGLQKISITFLTVVLILGALILILLSTLSIRERKYEIGVLRAMGMQKGNVALGFLLEMLVITVICLIVGIGIGAAISQPVANTLLQEQVQIAENANHDNTGAAANGGTLSSMGATASGGTIMLYTGDANAKPLSSLTVSLNIKEVIQIIFVALALTVISSAIEIFYVTRYEPMKILSERN